jgi:hypothetical protein
VPLGRRILPNPSHKEGAIPYRTRAQEALEHWRQIDRRLQSLSVDASERIVLENELVRIRDEYNAIVAEAKDARAPEPPPFPPDQGVE